MALTPVADNPGQPVTEQDRTPRRFAEQPEQAKRQLARHAIRRSAAAANERSAMAPPRPPVRRLPWYWCAGQQQQRTVDEGNALADRYPSLSDRRWRGV
jgi:hypothetical protein